MQLKLPGHNRRLNYPKQQNRIFVNEQIMEHVLKILEDREKTLIQETIILSLSNQICMQIAFPLLQVLQNNA